MDEYLPYSGTNSIQEAVVALHFQDMVASEAVRQARNTAQTELKSEFPHFSEIHQMQEIKVGPGGVSAKPGPARLAGFECSKVRADAKPARVLRFLDNILTVNFLEYRDWQTTRKDSLGYIRTVLSSVSLETNPVQAFSLRYIDRYTFDGPPDEPRAALLFRNGNVYMTPHCFSSGPSWHCHSGWFESYDAGDRILNQLKAGSATVDGVSTVTVDHNAVWQLRVPRQTTEALFGPSSGETISLEDALDFLHDRNKTILRDMLLADMLNKDRDADMTIHSTGTDYPTSLSGGVTPFPVDADPPSSSALPETTQPVIVVPKLVSDEVVGETMRASSEEMIVSLPGLSLTFKLLTQLATIQQIPKDERWPEAVWPEAQAFEDARTFIRRLPLHLIPLPEISLADDGEVNFLWQSDGVHVDLGFYGTGTCSYFAHDKDGKDGHRIHGEDVPASEGLPLEIMTLLTA